MFFFVLKNGRMTPDVLLKCIRRAGVAADSRRESSERLRQCKVVRSRNKPFALSDDATKERKLAHEDVIKMFRDGVAMGLGERLADLLDLEYLEDQLFTATTSNAWTKRHCPPGHAVCEAILHGPFQHGKMLPRDEMFQCEDCLKFHGRSRWLCVHCRDGRVRTNSNMKLCLRGYCPGAETQRDALWATGWKQPQPWMVAMNYQPHKMDLEKVWKDFLWWHGNPKAKLMRLRAAMEPAGVGRDLEALWLPIAYGQGQGMHTQLGNLKNSVAAVCRMSR